MRFVGTGWCALWIALVGCAADERPSTISIGDSDRDAEASASNDAAVLDARVDYADATAPRTSMRAEWLSAEEPPRAEVSAENAFESDQLYVVLAWENEDYESDFAVAPWDDLEAYRFGGDELEDRFGGYAMIDPVAGDLVYTTLDLERDASGVQLKRFRSDEGPLSASTNDLDSPLAACPAIADMIRDGDTRRRDLWLAPESGLVIMGCGVDGYEGLRYYTEAGDELADGSYGELIFVGRNGLTLWRESGGPLFIVDADGYAIQPIEPVFGGDPITAIEGGFLIAQNENWGEQTDAGAFIAQMSVITLRDDGSVERQIFPAAETEDIPLLHCAFHEQRALVCVELRPHIYREVSAITYYVNVLSSGELEIQSKPLPERSDGTFAFEAFVAKVAP